MSLLWVLGPGGGRHACDSSGGQLSLARVRDLMLTAD